MISKRVDCYVLAGAYGDLCIMLPLFKVEAERTGMKTIVVVRQSYAAMLEGVSYVEPVIFDGDAKGALIQAVKGIKNRFPDSAKVHFLNPGNYDRHYTTSFVTEMWQTIGRLEEWDTHPLVFDQRDYIREAALVGKVTEGSYDGRPLVLVSTKGRSAPFEHADTLLAYLTDELPECNVVDLGKVEAERPYDLLGLFDLAAMLVSIDTMHLHLSRASKVPVCAFVRDHPNVWKGSAWRPQYRFHARYSEFYARAKELLAACRDILAGAPPPVSHVVRGLMHDNYNPSIIRHEGRLLMAYRWHPDARSWRTKLGLVELDEEFKIIANQPISFPDDIRHLSIEDGRLFEFEGWLHISYTVSRIPQRPPYCVIQYGKLDYIDGSWVVLNPKQLPYGKNDFTGYEKNHVFFQFDVALFVIYQSFPEQVILNADFQPSTGLSRHEFRTPFPDWNWGEPHGGTTPLPYDDDHWIRFFHSRTMVGPKPHPWRYYVGAALMLNKPPFTTVALSDRPLLVGEEGYSKPYPMKQNVVFPAGAIKQGDDYLVSVGYNDSECRLVTFTKDSIKFNL